MQTNVVERSATLAPAFAVVARIAGHRPLALIELGASAGFNLLFDQFGYQYGDLRFGDPRSPVQLRCELRGERQPPLPATPPTVGWRVGVDLNPIDVADPEAARWLHALVWPDEPDRATLTRAAIELTQRANLQLVQGDALDHAPTLAGAAPAEATLCVFHSYVVNQIPPPARLRLDAIVEAIGRQRDIYRISAEWLHGPGPRLDLTYYQRGERHDCHLADCDAHGKWLRWLHPAV